MTKRFSDKIGRFFGASGGAYAALGLLLAICMISNGTFRNPRNLLNILRQTSYSGIIALGMTFVIAGGGIDLSVGSLFALCGVVTVMMANMFAGFAGPIPVFAVGVCVSLFIGAICGMANGLLVVTGGIPPFIATLGTYSVFRSLALYLADSGTLSASNVFFEKFGGGSLAGLPVPVWIMVLIAAALDCILSFTPFGRHLLATGANERVAVFSGIKTHRIRLTTYVLTGICAGVASLLFLGRLGSVSSSNAGMLYELDAIAAVIIGGASMSGGRGTLRGTLAGIMILGIVSNILDLWGVNVSLQGTVKGLVIIISVLVQRKGKI